MTVRHTNNKKHKGVAHHLPHRTRFRVSANHRDSQAVHKIRSSVMSVPGVKGVEINERTGSVLVHHDEEPAILESLSSAMEDLGDDIFGEIIEMGLAEIVPGGSLIGHLIRQKVSKIDTYLAELTNNTIDLKMLLPICFLGAGFYQASRNRSWFEQVPAWVLFYYAYDSYLKFHGPSVRQIEVASNGPTMRLKSTVDE